METIKIMKKLQIFTPYHVYVFELSAVDATRFMVQFNMSRSNGWGFSFQFQTAFIDLPKNVFEQTVIIVEDVV